MATQCLERNVDQIYHLETTLGEAPSHLMLPILKRASLAKLESILSHHPRSIRDYDTLWRSHVFHEFPDTFRTLSRSGNVTSPTPPPPDRTWRGLLRRRMEERQERLARTKRKLEEARKESEEARSRRKVKLLETPVGSGGRAGGGGGGGGGGGWGGGGGGGVGSAKKPNKFIAAAKREMAKRR
ncbi:hypothetical protein HDU96_004669 [Phlyctochytrium bullatum]|nr:hypothetical protein HDU96_004669 [Phlyctochytrium bullatum]